MRILLIGGNFYPEPTGIGKYNGEMIDWLTRHGCDCTVVTTYPYYPHWQRQAPYEKKGSWYAKETWTPPGSGDNYITVYRCPHYVPGKPDGKKRLLLDLSFSVSATFRVLSLLFRKKYDVVITVAPPFHLGFLAVLYKHVRRARFVYHVQDLQIEAARDLGMIKSKAVIGLFFRLERFILRQADFISTISEGMIRKIKEKTNREVLLFPNWSNIDALFPLPEKNALKASYGFDPTQKIILYSGAIGEKQGLHCIVEAAARLRGRKNLHFVVCGSGPYKERLIEMAREQGLDNITFLPLQPMETFNRFLNMADLHLILQKAGASDLVMPSKLTNILAVGGLALITADPGSSLYDLVDKHHVGLVVPSEDTDALVRGIEGALSRDHSDIHANSRRYAERFLSIDGVLSHYFASIHNPLV